MTDTTTETTNKNGEPTAKAFKVVLHVPSGRTHRPVTLFNHKFNGR